MNTKEMDIKQKTIKALCFINSPLMVVICIIGLIVCFISISTIQKHSYGYEVHIKELTDRITNDKEQINQLLTTNKNTNETVQTTQKKLADLTKRVEEVQEYQLEQYLKKSKEDEAKVNVEDTINNLQSQIGTLQFQVKDLSQKVYELNKTNITTTINRQAQLGSTIAVTQSVQDKPKQPVLKPLVPPLAILSIESRGGELFVSVAPSKSATLNQIKLLRVGDIYRSWQLKSIKTNAAVFTVGARQQVISIH